MLRPGGACLLTFFLLTPRSRSEIAAGRAALSFTHPVEGGATTDPGRPEEAIAFEVAEVRAMLAEAGLAVREPPHPGSWSNEPGAAGYQDIIVVTASR